MKKLEISKQDLKHNISIIKSKINDTKKDTKLIAVVKANGIGLRFNSVFKNFNRKWNR